MIDGIVDKINNCKNSNVYSERFQNFLEAFQSKICCEAFTNLMSYKIFYSEIRIHEL